MFKKMKTDSRQMMGQWVKSRPKDFLPSLALHPASFPREEDADAKPSQEGGSWKPSPGSQSLGPRRMTGSPLPIFLEGIRELAGPANLLNHMI